MRPQIPASQARCPVVLTIAGSDSGGGAGIQADLKTFAALGVFGTSALTCVTAQNPDRVSAIHALPPEMVSQQIRAVCEAFPVAAAKTGMLFSSELIRAVAEAALPADIPVLVVDPVMVAASGDRLLKPDAIDALCRDLLPRARVVTPNLHEAEILCGHALSSADDMRAAAREIGEKFNIACVIKGAHLGGEEVVDVLYDDGEESVFCGPRVDAAQSHGCGCAFSAALAACLARGDLLKAATDKARKYVAGALEHALSAGAHRPLSFCWNVQPGAPS